MAAWTRRGKAGGENSFSSGGRKRRNWPMATRFAMCWVTEWRISKMERPLFVCTSFCARHGDYEVVHAEALPCQTVRG